MLRRNFLRLLAALPAAVACGATSLGYTLMRTKDAPLDLESVRFVGAVKGGSYTLTNLDSPGSVTTYVWNESRQAFVRQS